MVSISCLQQQKHHLYGAMFCYKEEAVETQTYGISSTTFHLYLWVSVLNINQDTSYPDLHFSWIPPSPFRQMSG
jgi:hypothetical protein